MKALILLLSASLATAAVVPKVTFMKDFKGAVPPIFSIEVAKDGSAVYKEGPDDQQPVAFNLTPEATAEIFTRLEKIEYGKRPIESGLKVANLGHKTLQYVNGAEKNEVSYNYSTDLDAQALTDVFERLAETQQQLFRLESAVRFDKLGVNKILLQIEAAWDRNRLLSQERFIPLLQRVARNESFLNMSRERAARLAETFQHPKPAKAE